MAFFLETSSQVSSEQTCFVIQVVVFDWMVGGIIVVGKQWDVISDE